MFYSKKNFERKSFNLIAVKLHTANRIFILKTWRMKKIKVSMK
jgi:hypothetical protein